MWFSFDGDDFNAHSTPEDAKKAAAGALDEFRTDAGDGWDEAAYRICWGRVIQSAEVIEERPVGDDDSVDPDIEFIHEIELTGGEEHRCAICGGSVVFDGTPPVKGNWGGR